MPNDNQNDFDIRVWLRSMLYETSDSFAMAIADQADMVRNHEDAREAWLRAIRFPDLVSKLTYDYEADNPRHVSPTEWWDSDMFQRSAGEAWAAAIEAEIKHDAISVIHTKSPSVLGSCGCYRLISFQGSRPVRNEACDCGLPLFTPAGDMPRHWCCVCDDEEIAELEQGHRPEVAAE